MSENSIIVNGHKIYKNIKSYFERGLLWTRKKDTG